MLTILRSRVATIVVAMGVCHSAFAATIIGQGGTTYVNRGNGFVAVDQATQIPPGTQIMVSPGGSAIIRYSDTCAVRVPGGVWSTQAAPPCAQGVALIDFTTRMNQEAPPVEPTGPDTTTLVVGGLIVAGAVTAAVVLSQDDDKDDGANPGADGANGDNPSNDNPASQ